LGGIGGFRANLPSQKLGENAASGSGGILLKSVGAICNWKLKKGESVCLLSALLASFDAFFQRSGREMYSIPNMLVIKFLLACTGSRHEFGGEKERKQITIIKLRNIGLLATLFPLDYFSIQACTDRWFFGNLKRLITERLTFFSACQSS
jgi:hypothetical protein